MFERESLVNRGRDILDAALWSDWEKEVDRYQDDVYHGIDLLNALDVIALTEVHNYREAAVELSRQDHNFSTYRDVWRLIGKYTTCEETFRKYIEERI